MIWCYGEIPLDRRSLLIGPKEYIQLSVSVISQLWWETHHLLWHRTRLDHDTHAYLGGIFKVVNLSCQQECEIRRKSLLQHGGDLSGRI